MTTDPLELHKNLRGKIFIGPKTKIRTIEDLATLYTPGVAKPCMEIAKNKKTVYDYTMKGNTVAIVTDGTRVLGLGDIGPEAALPVMEGKALIMQQFGKIDAIPICLDCKDPDQFVNMVRALAPGFGAINLEDISTPKVFYIEKRLTELLDIPVFHDDQHGTAMVTLAGLYNALKVLGKPNARDVKIGIVGAGSAGYAIAKLLNAAGFVDIVVFDSKGAISQARSGLEDYKLELTQFNRSNFTGQLKDFHGADVLIAASSPGSIPMETIMNMKKPNIVFALSNPISEISIEQARDLRIDIFGTGRSDYPNQINNSLCFPGFLRALLDLRVTRITYEMKIAAAKGIAESVKNQTREKIVPDVFDKKVVKNIFKRVRSAIEAKK
ncbi:NAD-dependent malic enzyme [Candidatus Bilamarchaeum dharawalense]|uniref:NAD-dependent malic enzyme n=1 Tax=Candidatus Bilamarchaeum dharawalense TaxID=2885759 RepID=A0A5E4LVV4_9ARCH|nr:NAD-dependent malic enzyme [Candidatus Bilamarchaeum dharawalense]